MALKANITFIGFHKSYFILQSQDCSNLRMAAIALSGLNFDKGTIWRLQCMAAHEQIDDPHVRAMFAFLTPDNDHSYDTVLVQFSSYTAFRSEKHLLYLFFPYIGRNGCVGQ